MFPFPLPHIVYHVAGMGNWKEVVTEQLSLLREVGLSEAEVRITYLGDEKAWLDGKLRDFGINSRIVYSDPNLAHCETLAMQEVEKIAKTENSNNPILYFHTKGVSNPGDWGKVLWRRLMQEHVIRQWKLNLFHLKDHDAVGVNFHEGGAQHFSGTFWIANPNWIRRLPKFTEYHGTNGLHRYTCEMWIGSTQWCKAKSLGCRNEPFWNSGFDFNRFLPPKVPGHFDYRGTAIQQPMSILEVFPPFLESLKPARVLEIGTAEGGLSRFIRHTLNDLGMEDVPVTTVDVVYRDCLLIAQKEGVTTLTLEPIDPHYRRVHADIARFIQDKGKTLILCDGNLPPREFAAMTGAAKIGDVICAHDYAPTEDYFRSHVNDKVWNWLETTDALIQPTVAKYHMTRVEEDLLQKAVWCGYTKVTDGLSTSNYPKPTPGRVGLGILTYRRPHYFSQVIKAVVDSLDELDVVHIFNDGSPDREYFATYATLPERIKIRHLDYNQGVSIGKNYLLDAMMKEGCEYLFIMEDDIIIRNKNVFQAYINAHVTGKMEHLNFAHHGPANASGPVGKFSEQVDLFPNVVGAFSFYTNDCIRKCGLMDLGFKNVWEHVEHTARIAEAGLTSPFWQFADIVNSRDYLEEIPGSIESSNIRTDKKWKSNIEEGLNHWKNDLSTHCPL